MKPKFLVFLAVVVAAVVLYKQFPGLRTAVDGAVTKYGGWNEAAIEKDPAGFIKHAQAELTKNLADFEKMRSDNRAQKRVVEGHLKENQSDLENADNFATALKDQYQKAKADGSFPVTVLNAPYTEEKLIKQVEELLAAKSHAQKQIETYSGGLATLETQYTVLGDRINESKYKRDELEAQAIQVNIDKLTADTDKLLAQVNQVLIDNGKLAQGESGDSVRSLDELKAEMDKAAAAGTPAPAPKKDALAFLNS